MEWEWGSALRGQLNVITKWVGKLMELSSEDLDPQLSYNDS
jgi:hypothetical protein